MFDRALKAKRDWHNMLDYAKREAFAKGFAEELTKGLAEDLAKEKAEEIKDLFEIAWKLRAERLSIEKIATITGLPIKALNHL